MTDLERDVRRAMANCPGGHYEGWPYAANSPIAMSFAAIATVLRAMMEPSERMLEEARDWSLAKYGKPVGNDGATGCWQAMLTQFAKENGIEL